MSLTIMLKSFVAWLFAFGSPFDVPAPVPLSPIGQCDSADGSDRVQWTADDREEVRRRVRRACRSLGASPKLCAYYDAVVVRESSGMASVRHTLGKDENGLGPMGLSLKWHADKWPGRDEDPAFCTPEVSLAVAHAIVWRAVERYHAESLLDVQAIYGGRWSCNTTDTGERVCFADPGQTTVDSVCSRMRARGFSCYSLLTRADLGARIPRRERRAWALAAAARAETR